MKRGCWTPDLEGHTAGLVESLRNAADATLQMAALRVVEGLDVNICQLCETVAGLEAGERLCRATSSKESHKLPDEHRHPHFFHRTSALNPDPPFP